MTLDQDQEMTLTFNTHIPSSLAAIVSEKSTIEKPM